MARRRVHPDGPTVREVHVADADRLVTLDDPGDRATAIGGAFVRLRPPEGTTPDAVSAWRTSVEAVARAVKVLPAPRADDVPAAQARPDAGPERDSFRDEAVALAAETQDPDVVRVVGAVLDAVGA